MEKGQGGFLEREGNTTPALLSGTYLAGSAGLQPGIHRLVASPVVLAVVIGLLALWPRVLDLDVFVGPDEFDWVVNSANFAQGVSSGDFAKTYQLAHPGVTLMWIETVGAWLRYGQQVLTTGSADWTAMPGPDKSMATLAVKRQVMAVANTTLVVIAVLMIRQIFSPIVAWLAGLLLAFDPFLLTEARVLRTEGAVTAFVTLALLGLLLYLRREQRVSYSALAGALTGLALLSKVSAAALLPVSVLAIAGAPWLNRTDSPARRWRAAVIRLAAWGGALLLTVFLLWPALWVAPVEIFWEMYDYVGVRAVGGEDSGSFAFFRGATVPYQEIGPVFYLLVLLYRTSPLLWLGLLALGAVFWPGRRWLNGSWTILFTMLLFAAVHLVLITRSDLKFDRYILPMLPALIILAAVGLAAGWRWLAAQWPWLAGWGWLAGLVLLAGQMALALPHHPYYYTYWNPLLGGPTQAAKVLPVGAGEGIDRVVAYLNSLPNAESLTLVSANSDRIKPIFKGRSVSDANLNGEWLLADYTFIYILQLQQGKHHPETLRYLEHKPLAYLLTLHGLDYGWLYRGPGAEFFGGDTRLEGRATLHAYDLSATALTAGQLLAVTVYFRNEGQQPADRFYVRLVDGAGYVWSEGTVQPRPGFEEAFGRREAIVEGEAELALPVGMPPGEYLLKLGYENQALGELVGEFVLPLDAPRLAVSAAQGTPVEAVKPPVRLDEVIDERLELLGYGLEQAEVVPGEAVWLNLYWRALIDIDRDYAMAVQLLDGQGEEAAYWLGRPVHSGYGTEQWQAGQVVQDPWQLRLPGEISPGEYRLRVSLFDAASQDQAGQVELGNVTVVERRRLFDVPEMGRVVEAELNGGVRLLGYDLFAEPLPGGGRLRVRLYWQGQQELEESYTVFVQLLSPEGVLVAQHDGLPDEGRLPTTEWAEGEVIVDRHTVEFGQLEAGEYRLVVGMYESESGERLGLVGNEQTFVELERVSIE